jgi:hypothetical protein
MTTDVGPRRQSAAARSRLTQHSLLLKLHMCVYTAEVTSDVATASGGRNSVNRTGTSRSVSAALVTEAG